MAFFLGQEAGELLKSEASGCHLTEIRLVVAGKGEGLPFFILFWLINTVFKGMTENHPK